MAYEKIKNDVDYDTYEGLEALRRTLANHRGKDVDAAMYNCLNWEFDEGGYDEYLLHTAEKLAGHGTYGLADDTPTTFRAARMKVTGSTYPLELSITDNLGDGDVRLALRQTVDVRFLGQPTDDMNLEQLDGRIQTMADSIARTRKHYADRLKAAQTARNV